MQVKLEVLPKEERSDSATACWLCGRSFVVGTVACWAYGDDLDLGPVCPKCLEEGSDRVAERLAKQAHWSRCVAEQARQIAEEGISEMPTLEELRAMQANASR